MSAMAASGGLNRTAVLYQSVIGKKIVMALTGFILFGFILGHMAGNLQIFMGADQLNAYAKFLKGTGKLLWLARGVLLVSVVLHIVAATQLTLLKLAARPQGYVKKATIATSYAARTMIWSGPIILAFLIYHLLHFTTGQAHPNFSHEDVYRNVVIGFSNPAVSLFYMIANILLAFHLYHGVWSMFQSLGFNHPKYTPMLQAAAKAFGFVVAVGNVSMPMAVLTGIVQ